MPKALYMVFNDAVGKEYAIRLPECGEALTATQVAAAMDAILATNAVVSTNGAIVSKKEAYTIDTVQGDLTVV